MCKNIPLLTAKDVELRVQSQGSTWVNLLVYKDARCDMRILDDTFGPLNWKREHQVVNDNLFCTVSVWDDEKKQWVSKQDVGKPSKAESEKGEASDAFKRACFCWGIGRELYAAPTLFISTTDADMKNGKLKTQFSVAEMEYDKEQREFKTFVVVDDKNMVRFAIRNFKKEFIKEPYAYGGKPAQNVENLKTLVSQNQWVRLYANGVKEIHIVGSSKSGDKVDKWVEVTDLDEGQLKWARTVKEYEIVFKD